MSKGARATLSWKGTFGAHFFIGNREAIIMKGGKDYD